VHRSGESLGYTEGEGDRADGLDHEGTNMTGSPVSKAALSIFLAFRECGYSRKIITQKSVADACGISDYSVRE